MSSPNTPSLFPSFPSHPKPPVSHPKPFHKAHLREQKLLHNALDRDSLERKLASETEKRSTLSFYAYTPLTQLPPLRDSLYRHLLDMHVLGRIYLAPEGINAQISVPISHKNALTQLIHNTFPNAFINNALDHQPSFIKLIIKIKQHIVADGLACHPPQDHHHTLSPKRGTHVDAATWNQLLQHPSAVMVDIRNRYEHEVGHFNGALRMPTDTFRDQLKVLAHTLGPYKNKMILLYCTGGIRCEKASAHLLTQGFSDIYQLHGGITHYTSQVQKQGLSNYFVGKNFVFDRRLSESVTHDVFGTCYTCGAPCDEHLNCAWVGCHALFIQCSTCRTAFDQCCSKNCQEKHQLPPDKQRRQLKTSPQPHTRYKSRCQNTLCLPSSPTATTPAPPS